MSKGTKTLRPRRSRCSDCSKTSVLLPNYLLVRRVDEAAVIGSALTQKSQGIGHRKIAINVSRPATTVRGWIKRFGEKSKMLLEHFVGWALALDGHLSIPANNSASQTSGLSDTIETTVPLGISHVERLVKSAE